MKRARGVPALLLLAALAVAGCDGGGKDGAAAAKSTAPRTYVFHVDGPEEDMPFYPALFHRVTVDGVWGAPGRSAVLDDRSFEIVATPGERWQAQSERAPTPAEVRIFWQVRAEGVFGDETDIRIALPPRTRIEVSCPMKEIVVDEVTLYHEATDTRGWAINEPKEGLYEGIVDLKDARSYVRIAQPRPFVCDSFQPGRYVVAARIGGRQWTARRMELAPGGRVVIDAGAQPEGGREVLHDDANALLLLHGEFPIPAPRKRVDFAFRAVWEGVPPGRHAIRRSDGKVEELIVP